MPRTRRRSSLLEGPAPSGPWVKARSSRRRQSTESRSAFRQFLCDGVALKGSMVISTVQAWGTLYFQLKQRVVLCNINLYETYLF